MGTFYLVQMILEVFAFYGLFILVPALIFWLFNRKIFFGRYVLASLFTFLMPLMIASNNYFDLQQFVDVYALWGLPHIQLYSSLVWTFMLGAIAACWAAAYVIFAPSSKNAGKFILGFIVTAFVFNVIAKIVLQKIIYANSGFTVSPDDWLFILICFLFSAISVAYLFGSEKCRLSFFG